MTFTHDLLGRRTADFDTTEPTTSRRNYSYLPNGQLGSVESQSSSPARSYQIRYDEDGHPVTISEFSGTSLYNTYELFWLGDRLISTQIVFATPRPYATASPCLSSAGCFTYSSIRWHYHYFGDVLISATRERVHTDGTVWSALFYFLTDERGLIHRVLDAQGGTWWQAHWDAQGTRTYVGRPQPEMWIPFALPGQILLGDYDSEMFQNIGVRTAGTEATIKPVLSATASSVESPHIPSNATDKNLATRWSSLFSDPQWMTVDLGTVKPVSGVRLTWETAYASGYRIEVSNSSSGPWTTVFSTTTGNGAVDEISFSASARYVRMYGTQRATPWGYSLWEFEVFGPWTRPAIALNQWRAYDPMSAAFFQPDAADDVGRARPEGYPAFRSNALRYTDPTGRTSYEYEFGKALQKYEFGNCSLEQQQEVIEALGKGYLNLAKCTSGLCLSESFKRNLYYNMSRGMVSCNYDFDDGVIMSATGLLYSDELGYVVAASRLEKLADGAFRPRRVLNLTDIGKNYDDLHKKKTCLAYQIVHETGHQSVRLTPRRGMWKSGQTDDPSQYHYDNVLKWLEEIKPPTRKMDMWEENAVMSAFLDCDLCK